MATLKTSRHQAAELLEKLTEAGVSFEQVVNHVINNWMSGDDAKAALEDLAIEEGILDEEEQD